MYVNASVQKELKTHIQIKTNEKTLQLHVNKYIYIYMLYRYRQTCTYKTGPTGPNNEQGRCPKRMLKTIPKQPGQVALATQEFNLCYKLHVCVKRTCLQ